MRQFMASDRKVSSEELAAWVKLTDGPKEVSDLRGIFLFFMKSLKRGVIQKILKIN